MALALTTYAAEGTHWVATWATSPSPQLDEPHMRFSRLEFENQTVREIIHTSIGSNTVRVRLSNAYGGDTLYVGAAHIALPLRGARIAGGSDRVLTFSGGTAVAIPPNALALSDPVKLEVPATGDVAISIFIPRKTVGAGVHYASQQTSYIGPGDLTGAPAIDRPVTIPSWVFLAGVDVLAPEPASAVVAIGDSITDGDRSRVDANHRWTDTLARRLAAQPGRKKVAVVNAGIGGNRILHDATINVRFGVNALARFERDVLAQPGAKYVLVLEGTNDLGHPGAGAPLSETVRTDELIAGMKQMIERAHEHGLRIFGATLAPFEGVAFPGFFTPEKDAKRKALNEFIRNGGAFDGVIDFEKAVRDPKSPSRLLPAYDSGDHVHPSDAGYRAMGESIDLALFNSPPPR